MAVGMGGYHQYLRRMDAKHFGGVGVHRNLPSFGEKAAAFPVNVAAGNKGAVGIGGDCAGMGAGFFPQAVFFKQAGNATETDNGGVYFHGLCYQLLSRIFKKITISEFPVCLFTFVN
jgi:hypothetical protein